MLCTALDLTTFNSCIKACMGELISLNNCDACSMKQWHRSCWIGSLLLAEDNPSHRSISVSKEHLYLFWSRHRVYGSWDWHHRNDVGVSLPGLPSLQVLHMQHQCIKGSLNSQSLKSIKIAYDPNSCKLIDRSKAAADIFGTLPALQNIHLQLIRPALQVSPDIELLAFAQSSVSLMP